MKRSLLFLLFYIVANISSFSQQDEKRVFLKSNRSTFKIKSEKCNYIRITLDQQGDSLKYFTTSTKGQLFSSSPIEISLTPSYSITIKTNNNCFNQKAENYYPLNSAPIKLKVEDISILSFQSNSARSCLVIGSILSLIGSITTLVIAPLMSIDYKTGAINSQEYYNIAAVGLGLGIVSIPLFVFSKERKFNLKSPKDTKTKVWKIIK